LLAATAAAVIDAGPATGTAEIARRAGVTKGALQHHFPSKHDLLLAVVVEGWEGLVERSYPAQPRSSSPAKRLRSLVDSMWISYQQPACRAAFMISSDPSLDGELGARILPVFESMRGRLDAVWGDTFADLDVPPERLVDARRFARSHLVGMLVQRQLPSPEPDPGSELSMLCVGTLHLMLPAERR